jgi:PKD repeat protein
MMIPKSYFCLLTFIWLVGCKLEEAPLPVAKFAYTGGECNAPCNVIFADKSDAGVYDWNYAWKFGDGATSEERNPTHKYTAGGKFAVTLTLTGKYGTATTTDTVHIKGPIAESPVANFTMAGGNCEAPCEVTFTNTSLRAVSYAWNFGDKSEDSVSTVQSPKHIFKKEGTFNVKLTVTGAGGTHSKVESVVIKAAVVLNADFSFTHELMAPDSIAVTFKNKSTGATKYDWEFGDTKTSTVPDPIHKYANKDSSYVVKLKAYGKGDTSKTKTDTLKIKKK